MLLNCHRRGGKRDDTLEIVYGPALDNVESLTIGEDETSLEEQAG